MKKALLRRSISSLLSISLIFGLFCMSVSAEESQPVPIIKNIVTDKSMYDPGETVTFSVEVSSDDYDWEGQIYIDISHLENAVSTITDDISISSGETLEINLEWTLPEVDFQGYLAKAYIDDNSYATTAIDCSSDFAVFPRYGYISDFDLEQSNSESSMAVAELAQKYHINSYQLYDWMWRHDTLVKRSGSTVNSSWQDLFNRTISSQTISDYIEAIHQFNGNAMAYVMSYAAREGYTDYGIDPSAGLFLDQGHASQLNVDFGNNSTYLWLFNPQNSAWQETMTEQYIDAVNTFGFDGLQIDQMGQRNGVYDYRGQQVFLEDTFSSFVNASKDALTENNSTKDAVTFNIVDGTVYGWALDNVATYANTDFNFSEIWWLSNNYNDIKNYIEQVKTLSNGKALVLAAYMNYNDNYGQIYEAEEATLESVSTNNNHTGYTGTGFVDGFIDVGDAVTFDILVTEPNTYSFVFNYANSTGSSATRKVYVDDELIDQVTFGSNSTWDEWAHDANCSAYLSEGQHSIKLSYDSGCYGAINLDNITLGEFDENSVRLANATFAACGASHIELGTNGKDTTMLSHEYYPMNSKSMSYDLEDAMEEHYDFITAYENLLFAPEINYGDTGTQYISIENEEVSGSGEKGKIWYVGRQTDDYQILHLINLTGETDTQWRNVTQEPDIKENLSVKYYISPDAYVDGVYLASPDFLECQTQALEYTLGEDDKGTYLTFVIPSLEYWDMVYISL